MTKRIAQNIPPSLASSHFLINSLHNSLLKTRGLSRRLRSCSDNLLAKYIKLSINCDLTPIIMGSEGQGYALQPASRLELTDECHHYQKGQHVPWDLQKFAPLSTDVSFWSAF
jgi:hypothetical protein